MSQLQIARDVPLTHYSTMRLGGTAAYATAVTGRQQVAEAYGWALERGLPCLMVGSGSNIVWRDEGFPGLLLVNKISRFELFQEDAENSYVTIGGGENWDAAVGRCVEAGLTGIEALSLVPGTAGATPIQNVGAYGQDISQTLSSLEAFDTHTQEFLTIPAADCSFGYRTSRFKTTDHGRYFITAITLHLTAGNPRPPFYPALQTYLVDHKIATYTPAAIRDAVIAIRSAKLPDPGRIANNGSFFANPVVSEELYVQITGGYDTVPHWPVLDADGNETGQIKLAAAWLIDQAGFKDYHDEATGMATWASQSLVLVNEHAKATADLLAFKQRIVDGVRQKFEVSLEQEPELLPQL